MSKKLKTHILLHLTVVAVIVAYFLLRFECPIKHFFHIPCPTCGMTHSLIALMKGDVWLSLSFNPLTVPFIILFLFGIHKDLFKLKKRTNNIIIISGTVVLFITYIVELIV